MENGLVIQLLILAGIIAYGVWSARQKGKRGEDKVPHRMPGGENFPFPVSDNEPPMQEETLLFEEEKRSVDEGHFQYKNAVQTDFTDGGAVATVTFEEDDMIEEQELSPEVVEKQPVVTDLRTIIISSELLKPKYEEY